MRWSTPIVDAFLVLAAFAGMTIYLFTVVPEFLAQSQGGDYPYYVAIAQSPIDNAVPSPWRYRLLNPWLASVLAAMGMPINLAFLVLTYAFAFASCVLMTTYLRQLGLSTFGSRVGALLFAVTVGGFIPIRRYYGYTDAMMNCFTLLALMLLVERRHGALAVSLGVGTFAKESLLLLLPFVGERLLRLRTHWRVTLPVIGAPLAAYLLLRVLVPPDATGESAIALSWQAQVEYWRTAMVNGLARWVLWAFAYSFGPLWLLAAIGSRQNGGFIRAALLLLLPLLVPLVRTTDTERVLMLTFPVVLPLAACALDKWRGTRAGLVVAGIAIGCSWLAQLTFGWPSTFQLRWVSAKDVAFIGLCVAPLLAWVVPGAPPGSACRLRWPGASAPATTTS